MSDHALSVEAVFENGVLRPDQPLPLRQQERVTITVHRSDSRKTWPEDVADIYREIAEEDRRLALAMSPAIRETWPTKADWPTIRSRIVAMFIPWTSTGLGRDSAN